jgi:hypothetical protein
VFDSNVLSLDEFAFTCGVGPLSRRHIVDAFATVAWFNALTEHAGAQTVAEVARRYALPGQDSPEQRKMAHRQWAERSKGFRTPSVALIEYTDRQCEGSAALFNHDLWIALRVDKPAERHTDAMLQRLPPRFHRLVELKTLPKGNDDFRKMRNLSRSGSLEDLDASPS